LPIEKFSAEKILPLKKKLSIIMDINFFI